MALYQSTAVVKFAAGSIVALCDDHRRVTEHSSSEMGQRKPILFSESGNRPRQFSKVSEPKLLKFFLRMFFTPRPAFSPSLSPLTSFFFPLRLFLFLSPSPAGSGVLLWSNLSVFVANHYIQVDHPPLSLCLNIGVITGSGLLVIILARAQSVSPPLIVHVMCRKDTSANHCSSLARPGSAKPSGQSHGNR